MSWVHSHPWFYIDTVTLGIRRGCVCTHAKSVIQFASLYKSKSDCAPTTYAEGYRCSIKTMGEFWPTMYAM